MKSFKKLFAIAIISLALSFVLPYMPFMDAGSTIAEAAKISKKSLVLIKGQSAILKVSGTKKRPKWTSSRRTVATVSSRGKVVAKKKGTTTITAKIGAKKYSCRVTVQTPSISKKNVSLTVGKSTTLKLNGTKQKVTWKSSNKKVATINSKGKIVAKKTGKTTITATVLKKKYTCKVTVKAKSPVQIINPKPNNPKPSNPTPEKPNTPSTPVSGSRTNPLSGYNITTMTIDDYPSSDYISRKSINLQLIEVIDGEQANQIVMDENMFNTEADSSNRWVLYHFRLSYLSGDEEINGSSVISHYDFYNQNATIALNNCETATLSDNLNSIYDLRLYPGGSGDMWIGLLLDNSIPYTTYKIDRGYDSHFDSLETWFTTKK